MGQADEIVTLEAGTYRLLAPIGASAYGVVWRAQARQGLPDVALKFVNRAQMARALPAQRPLWPSNALREIAFLRSLAAWDQRHIVRLLDSGAHDGLPVMALELLHGDLAARREPDVATALAWIGQLNQALAKVHQYGWTYLDLKPANVLLTHDGNVKLADFGTSRLRSARPCATYAGSANWQAPEQFFPTPQQRYDTDPRTDYFALGALLYYLVTGVALRFCSDCGQAYREHQGAAAATLRARDGAIPPTLHAHEEALFARRFAQHACAAATRLLRCLLAPERAQRPQHALHISRMLGDLDPGPA